MLLYTSNLRLDNYHICLIILLLLVFFVIVGSIGVSHLCIVLRERTAAQPRG
jgi:hypothetical protein